MKTVTWNRILRFNPYGQSIEEETVPYGWRKAIDYWKPKSLEEEVSIPMILESNGLDDAIWTLCAFEKDHVRDLCLFKADVAEIALHAVEEKYPNSKALRKAIEGTRLFTDGKISEEELDRRVYAAYAVAYNIRDFYGLYVSHSACETVYAVRSTNIYGHSIAEIDSKIKDILLKYFGE